MGPNGHPVYANLGFCQSMATYSKLSSRIITTALTHRVRSVVSNVLKCELSWGWLEKTEKGRKTRTFQRIISEAERDNKQHSRLLSHRTIVDFVIFYVQSIVLRRTKLLLRYFKRQFKYLFWKLRLSLYKWNVHQERA